MQEFILKILQKELGNAKDDFWRASHRFVGYLPAEMQKQYGESGTTRQQILDNYKANCDRLLKAIEWLENV